MEALLPADMLQQYYWTLGLFGFQNANYNPNRTRTKYRGGGIIGDGPTQKLEDMEKQ